MAEANHTADLLSALKLALPYVQKLAATAPTEMHRQRRQQQAVRDVRAIEAVIAAEESAR